MTRGLGIFELVSDAREMRTEDFERKHGSYFLIRTLDDGTLNPPTSEFGGRSTTEMLNVKELTKQNARLENPEATYLYPLRPQFSGQAVIVGRLSHCHVQIDDKSVSKDHAKLIVERDGGLSITDLGSKNGTKVGTHRLPPNSSTSVQFGKTIEFGAVRLTYLPVRQLVDFIRATFDQFERLDTVSDLVVEEEDFDVHVEFDDD